MSRALRRGLYVVAVVAALAVASPAAAAGATFYVSPTGSDAGNDCELAATPCLTIAHAVATAEVVPGLGVIALEPGTYITTVDLTNLSDFGLTIEGLGSDPTQTVIEGPGGAGQSTVDFGTSFGVGSLTLANLTISNPVGNQRSAISGGAALTLSGVDITLADTTSGAQAISAGFGPTTLTNVAVTVDGSGDGIDQSGGALTMTSSTVTLADTSGSGDAVSVTEGSATLSACAITVDDSGDGVSADISPLAIATTTFSINGTGAGVFDVAAAAGLSGDNVSMNDAGSGNAAVGVQAGAANLNATTIRGVWHGAGVAVQGGGATIVASNVSTATVGNTSPAVVATGGSPSGSVLIQRSSLTALPNASPGTVAIQDDDLVTDSSLILGGRAGIAFGELNAKANGATIDSTTVDAGAIGVGAQSGVSSVDTTAGGGHVATVAINGSILVQSPVATVSGNAFATVTCVDTDAPNTAEPPSPSLGAINCATGANGNTSSTPSSLFVTPGSNYQLLPTSAAVDSVAESAIALPDGYTEATLDLAGNPRIADGNGDCVALRDRGAYELQGHAGTIPTPVIAAPASVVTNVVGTYVATVTNDPAATLAWQFSDATTAAGPSVTHAFATAGAATVTVTATGSPATCAASASVAIAVVAPPALGAIALAPARFRPAGSGGSVALRRRGKTGTVVSYDDTEAATLTFTVSAPRRGRLVDSVCRKPSARNRRKPRCTLEAPLGQFTHTDVAGANTFIFTGRLGGRALRAGTYQLKGVPTNANGAGAAVVKTFTIA